MEVGIRSWRAQRPGRHRSAQAFQETENQIHVSKLQEAQTDFFQQEIPAEETDIRTWLAQRGAELNSERK